VLQETITANVSEDAVTLEFQRSDGTLITQLMDFRNVSAVPIKVAFMCKKCVKLTQNRLCPTVFVFFTFNYSIMCSVISIHSYLTYLILYVKFKSNFVIDC
jgi:hypothetical protein